MNESAAKEDAVRQRIITHMNNDHQDSAARYLEAYCKVSRWTACGARMTDIDLHKMSFMADGATHQVAFDPPLQSLKDTRERVAAMDKECISMLGRSDITVKEFAWPTGLYAIDFFGIAATFLAYSRRTWFQKGAIVECILGAGFARFSYTIQPWLLAGLIVVHGAELVYYMRKPLVQHSVNVRSRIYWQWVVSFFIEGLFAYHRWHGLIERKRIAKAKQKH